jgi:hypothetical protein
VGSAYVIADSGLEEELAAKETDAVQKSAERERERETE